MKSKKTLALAMAMLLLASALSGCTPSTTAATPTPTAPPPATATPVPPAETEQWDREVDFLIVGYGLAGASAAVEAHDIDPNAKILVLEKMPETLKGGNSRASGQTFIVPEMDEVAKFQTYMEAMGSTNPIPDEYMTWLCEGFAEQLPWISQVAQSVDYEVGHVGGGPLQWGKMVTEFADLPGSDFKGCSAHLRKAGGPSFELGGLFNCLDAATTQRGVEVLYGTPATALVQDPDTKAVLGVIAKDLQAGTELRIKAGKGVLLACGGYENNLQMQRDFHGMEYVYTAGTPGNTGDGIQMLMEAGAQLWHMKNQTQSGGFWLGVKSPDYEAAFIRNMTFKTGSWLEVDATSSRYYDEAPDYYHQHMKYHEYGRYADLPEWRALPTDLIFDENTRVNNSIVSQWLAWPISCEGYAWSLDNSAEIEKGWIIKADTIEELAEKTNRDPAALQATIDRYNAMVDKGVDEDFGRDITTMQKIEKAPFYAVSLTPALVATTGGAKRDTQGRVLDWNDEPIPGLYEAGELGSYVSNLYQNGVFLSECFLSGRTAAQTAMGGESKVTVTLDELYAGASVGDSTAPWSALSDGSYTSTVTGTHGDIGITITVAGGKLTKVERTPETKMLMTDDQLKEYTDELIAAQSIKVDAISGATLDSQSVVEAIQGACAKK